MSKRRKRQRMHSREVRRENAAKLAALPPPTQEQLDRALIVGMDSTGRTYDSPVLIAQAWLGERDELEDARTYGDAEGVQQSRALIAALERRFEALAGAVLTEDDAEALIEPNCEDDLYNGDRYIYD